MEESFEEPPVQEQTRMKGILDGWTNPMHPSYINLEPWPTQFGNQALSVFGFKRGFEQSAGGAETTDEILNALVEAGTAYTLTFNVAAKSGKKGNYVVELDAVDSQGIKTKLASTSGVATTEDMSEIGSVRYYASSSGLAGQRLMIRLLQGDSGSYTDTPIFDNVKLVAEYGALDLLSMPIQKHNDDRVQVQVSSDGSILVRGDTKFAKHVKNMYAEEPEPTASGD